MEWFTLVVGFLTGAVAVGLPLFYVLRWSVRRSEKLEDRVDSLSLQLGNALLELRTDAVLEMWVEDEEEEGE